jgi:hypothetical protein
MKRKLLGTVCLGLLIIALSGSALAWSGRAVLDGKPVQFNPGASYGYYVWQDDHGFHIWTSVRGQQHIYSGDIKTDGVFYRVSGHRLESDDSFKVYSDIQEHYWFKFSEGDTGKHFFVDGRTVDLEKNRIHFSFNNTVGSDGLNFRVRDANYIEFNLFVDGRPVAPRDIHISATGWHPGAHDFRLYN